MWGPFFLLYMRPKWFRFVHYIWFRLMIALSHRVMLTYSIRRQFSSVYVRAAEKSLLFDNSEMAELAYCDIYTLLNYNNGYFSRFLM